MGDWTLAYLLILLFGGWFAGLVGGLLGVGGGVVVVPLLHLVFGLPLPLAVGTSLVVITGTSVAGTAGYLDRGLVDLNRAVGLEFGALLGALGASWAAPWLPEALLAYLFAAALSFTAIYLWWRSRSQDRSQVSPRGTTAAYLLSPVAGGVAGLLGIGGGIVQVPLLRLLLGLDMRRAVATSTATVGWTASVAAAVYLRRGEVQLEAIPFLLTGILVGGASAPRVGSHLPLRLLEGGFSLLLLYAAVRMVMR